MPDSASMYAKSKNSFEELVMRRSSGDGYNRKNSLPRESELPFKRQISSIDDSLYIIEADIL